MKRLTYIDVSKGLFMLIVVYYHMICIPQRACVGLVNDCNSWILETPNLFRAFFMAGFFFVSGMTSKFKRPIKEQIINDAKTLLLPSMLICTITALFYPDAVDNGELGIIKTNLLFGGGAWFITTMFLARFFYKLMLKIEKDKLRWALIFVIWIFGCLADRLIPTRYEFWYLPKALVFLPFLELGHSYYKIENLKIPFETICVILYIVVIVILMALGITTPYVTGTSSLKPIMIPVFAVASVTGSVAVFKLGKIINSNRFLEYVGKNTLVFYLTHMTFLWIACKVINDHYDMSNMSVWMTLAFLLALFVGAILWSSLFSYLLNTKYLKWILGKF